ncbi:MAG: type II toxin-antitoxin system RelE/ParE family toxin [Pirellulales bacterium]
MKIRYHASARIEVIESANYYAAIRPELGLAFLGELDTLISTIAVDPLRYEQVRPGIHRCLMNRFPYGIYYRVPDAETIRIIIVRHHSRRPWFGMRRK